MEYGVLCNILLIINIIILKFSYHLFCMLKKSFEAIGSCKV